MGCSYELNNRPYVCPPPSTVGWVREDMTIDTDVDLDESKTLKVTLPASMHLKLHSLKVLTGTNISETVEEAVEAHLAEEYEDEDIPILPAGGE